MNSLNYGSHQKCVNTKVVPFHELIKIAIDNFPLKCTPWHLLGIFLYFGALATAAALIRGHFFHLPAKLWVPLKECKYKIGSILCTD